MPRSDEWGVVLIAQAEHTSGRSEDAINRLRPWQGTHEACVVSLAQIYADKGMVDEAVETLFFAATKFQQPALFINAGRVLLAAGRPGEDAGACPPCSCRPTDW